MSKKHNQGNRLKNYDAIWQTSFWTTGENRLLRGDKLFTWTEQQLSFSQLEVYFQQKENFWRNTKSVCFDISIKIQISTSGCIHTPLKPNLLRIRTVWLEGAYQDPWTQQQHLLGSANVLRMRCTPALRPLINVLGGTGPRTEPRETRLAPSCRPDGPSTAPLGALLLIAQRAVDTARGSIKEHRWNPEALCLREKNKIVLNCK